ncbi:MAG: transcription elongation factor GreA [Candidatus Doudnabacteria bacterium RIFCSPLOWO2_02_FULL_49_13]|uniref:Transcription elongation factor GreA n=1 Tax=Candidatus Doudnabacteria bacterium RIFCSPHIGHO2_12_FULL_48_16 TaxID=1817838 RepID=A0A1F5PIB0_9BACT|nr:MAG: transcription elongation factor GreA [Candidatus Doudnabacteria bacterium RIFCSPHIGHO2_02_FULL_49_24]OGE89365.1 MAG: transcription elongation factor GreA [Candidatus Doudnabacteria bacterium RIFCSPHIGHO2_01_FULL_50_67]OGE89678.1 MAG: transcription elongation factor GreA [Candidatus Doudnabacteria bacterium RIFCSPHIGHO2_12_FULL_48_16]OGE97511.1 MAG: transcription elongation factor GreA [Candidatus Doudnabacteria bacterium RIFCSPLOWO2_01_FULL_49_40]OGF03085.1 MAG: transcription elongation
MNKAVLLTEDGLKKLQDEVKILKEDRRREVIERIQEAVAHGDLSENADYAQAKEEQAFIEGRIQEIEEILKNAQIIAASKNKNIVSVGSTVVLKFAGNEVKYTIVGANEANPAAGKISNESLVGKALLGAKKGDRMAVDTPAGKNEYEILNIE